jgi:hypothetical protein
MEVHIAKEHSSQEGVQNESEKEEDSADEDVLTEEEEDSENSPVAVPAKAAE